MTAIDFTKLLRDAKKQAKKQQPSKPTNTTPLDTVSDKSPHRTCSELPLWNPLHTPSLSFHHTGDWNLQKVCSDPPSIYYSPKGLDDTQPLWDWLASLPHGDSGIGEWKTMTYGKRNVCMFQHDPLPPPLSILAQHLVSTGIFPSNQPPNHVLLNEYQPSQGILPHTDGPRYASRTATLSLGSPVVLHFTKRLTPDQIGTSIAIPTIIATTNTSASDDANHDYQNSDRDVSPQVSSLLLPQTRSIVLHANSWIVFEDDAYIDYCHGIAMNVWEDITDDQCLNAPAGVVIPRGRRFSLTFRHLLLQLPGEE